MQDTKQGPLSSSEVRSRRYSPIAEAARAVTRPIVTVMFAGALTGLAIEGADPPPWFLGLAIPCVTWWFGERFLQRRKEEK